MEAVVSQNGNSIGRMGQCDENRNKVQNVEEMKKYWM